jgi:protein-tyrosine phosphatase
MSPFRNPPSTRFDQVANFRDLGGHTTRDGARVRHGRLFRSGHLAHATDDDVERLAELGVRRIFDFRTLGDIEADGRDRMPRQADHLRLPMPDHPPVEDLRTIIRTTSSDEMEALFGDGKAAEMMIRAAETLVRERHGPYRLFLRELSSADSFPALFHCSAGKDRAGWAGTLVLLAIGVEEEQVVEQYLLSNQNLESIRERLSSVADERWANLFRPFLEVRREYIEASFRAVHADWGSFDRYLHEGLGITDEERALLRDALLE